MSRPTPSTGLPATGEQALAARTEQRRPGTNDSAGHPARATSGGTGRPWQVYPLLAVGLACFAASAILIRLAGEAPGLAVAVWRTVFSVIILAPAVLVKRGRGVGRFSGREIGLITLAGVLLGLHFVMWIESLYHTSVASASVLVTTSPIFLAILGYVFLREKVSLTEIAGILLGFAGAALMSLGDAGGASGSNTLLGNGLAFGAALVVSLYMLIGRAVRQQTSWLGYVFPLYVVAALTTFTFALVGGTPLFGYDAEFYGLCLVMAVGPQILGHGSLNYALRYFSAALLGLLTLLEPVGASIVAYFLFDEVPALLAVVGILLVLASVTFVILQNRRRYVSRRRS